MLSSYATDPLCQAVEQAWNAGIVVVVAAGNEGRNNSAGTNGYGTITSPGNDPLAITVGAMNTLGTPARSDDKIASYSSKGPSQIDHVIKPDLVAWKSHYFGHRWQFILSFPDLSAKRGSQVHLRGQRKRKRRLFSTERDEHGRTHGQWVRSCSVAEESDAHAGPGESHSHENGFEVSTDDQRRHRTLRQSSAPCIRVFSTRGGGILRAAR